MVFRDDGRDRAEENNAPRHEIGELPGDSRFSDASEAAFSSNDGGARADGNNARRPEVVEFYEDASYALGTAFSSMGFSGERSLRVAEENNAPRHEIGELPGDSSSDASEAAVSSNDGRARADGNNARRPEVVEFYEDASYALDAAFSSLGFSGEGSLRKTCIAMVVLVAVLVGCGLMICRSTNPFTTGRVNMDCTRVHVQIETARKDFSLVDTSQKSIRRQLRVTATSVFTVVAALKVILEENNVVSEAPHMPAFGGAEADPQVVFVSVLFALGFVLFAPQFSRRCEKVAEEQGRDLQWSSYYGNIARVRKFLKNGADPNEINKSMVFQTALSAAAERGRTNVCEVLLNNGARVNQRGFEHLTALQYAVRYEHFDTCQLLLEHGANVNFTNKFGLSPLHEAAWNEDKCMYRFLLENGANENAETTDGRKPCDCWPEARLKRPSDEGFDFRLTPPFSWSSGPCE